ncbi:uncharacterized protein C8Q71DRAFT_726629 [Rhodofomes roseus]|uniref:Uncharacterized protein n=1 Tax=Rhodofomes roseus TaxID=34475 RepID=A0ABQ8K4F8_9APHY|nr:uncharacterized protein C8Q71DRAFT_726629 [Rhodofomes roseus]KAH9831737.1 hypothetical protein C8Q71DRAFT_726629 [Rhodofomes roseus]
MDCKASIEKEDSISCYTFNTSTLVAVSSAQCLQKQYIRLFKRVSSGTIETLVSQSVPSATRKFASQYGRAAAPCAFHILIVLHEKRSKTRPEPTPTTRDRWAASIHNPPHHWGAWTARHGGMEAFMYLPLRIGGLVDQVVGEFALHVQQQMDHVFVLMRAVTFFNKLEDPTSALPPLIQHQILYMSRAHNNLVVLEIQDEDREDLRVWQECDIWAAHCQP